MKEIEILGANRFSTFTKTREGSRAVIVRDGMILLSHETISGWYLVPGGGLEAGEPLVSGCLFVFLPLGICVDFQKCVDFLVSLVCIKVGRVFSPKLRFLIQTHNSQRKI